MNNMLFTGDLLKNMVSITELNKGKASKIIEEVKKTGYKVILKNNSPEAVLITPEQFEELISLREEILDMTLGMEALKRMSNFNVEETISHEDILGELGISQDELDDIEVSIE
jgi:PHD/YefM family antitoxin component YafN of YafNO toxin-antitoxin module